MVSKYVKLFACKSLVIPYCVCLQGELGSKGSKGDPGEAGGWGLKGPAGSSGPLGPSGDQVIKLAHETVHITDSITHSGSGWFQWCSW